MTAREKILLERYRLGELPEEMKKEVEQMPGLEKAVQELDDSDKEILDQYHFSAVERKIRRHKARKMSRFIAAAAALVLFAGGGLMITQLKTTEASVIRVKGNVQYEPSLTLYRMENEEVENLEDGSAADAGDLIQIGYKNISGSQYGLILSLDGAGNQTIHFPLSGDEAQLLDEGGEYFLPWSYELDDAPDYEVFFLILSDQPFTMKDISAAALLENKIPRGVDVIGMTLNKRN